MKPIGEDISFVITGTILIGILCFGIILFVILYSRSQLKFKLERQQFKQALLESEVEIRKETLKAVSQDLHDNIGQIASLIKINLNLLSPKREEQELNHLNETKGLLQQLINDVKTISTSLANQEITSNFLTEQIEKDLERISQTGFIKVEFESTLESRNIKPDTAVFLYRMFQEATNNMLKHAKATLINIKLSQTNHNILLSLQDNGIGFSMDETKPGNGLKNIQERCRVIGAQHQIKSSKNKGTFIQIQYPINKL